MIGISDLETESRLSPRAIVYLGHAPFPRGELTRYKNRISCRLFSNQKRSLKRALNSAGPWDLHAQC
jgi:hypothetical protein